MLWSEPPLVRFCHSFRCYAEANPTNNPVVSMQTFRLFAPSTRPLRCTTAAGHSLTAPSLHALCLIVTLSCASPPPAPHPATAREPFGEASGLGGEIEASREEERLPGASPSVVYSQALGLPLRLPGWSIHRSAAGAPPGISKILANKARQGPRGDLS